MKEKENTVPTSGKKKALYAVIIAVCALLLVAATVLTAYFVANGGKEVLDNPPDSGNVEPNQPENPPDQPDTPPDDEPDDPPDDPTGGETVLFISPVDSPSCTVEYMQLYKNNTLDRWVKHKAVDYGAPAGTEVRAMADGEVLTISVSPELGNIVVVKHTDGIVATYRFVEPDAGLKEKMTVKQGQVIGKVAEAYGTEAKDGAHLHLEMELDGKSVDPMDYIDVTLEEK